ncbi:hypothetical protein D3C87_1416220 [compost metagenome]
MKRNGIFERKKVLSLRNTHYRAFNIRLLPIGRCAACCCTHIHFCTYATVSIVLVVKVRQFGLAMRWRGAGSEITTLPIFAPNRQGLLTGLGVAGWVLPPLVRRGEGTRSGAPSWTTVQTQAVQGCTVCVVPPDLLPEPREPDVGGRTSGGGLSFGDFSLATQRKVTRPSPKGGRNPVEGSALVSCMAKPCQSG